MTTPSLLTFVKVIAKILYSKENKERYHANYQG